MGKQRSLLCVYQHAPTRGAPGIYRHRMLLAELVRRGWRVDLVGSPINYMTGELPAGYRGRFVRRETIDGIHHHWATTVGGVHRSLRRRLANYASFAASATMAGLAVPRPDVIWASSPPLSVGTVGDLLAHLRRRPWIFEVRDLWPESAASVGWIREDSRVYRFAERLAHRYARTAQGVIVPTPGLAEEVRGHGATDPAVITGALTPHEPDAAVRAAQRERVGAAQRECVVLYAGAHGAANGLGTVLDAAKLLTDEQIRFVMAGDGGERELLERRVRNERIGNVQLLGPLARDDVHHLLQAADVCLHALRDDPLFATALPTKVLGYLSAHKPFVTTVHGLPERIARASGGGFAPTAHALADELRTWARMPDAERTARGELAYEYGMEHYGLDATVDRLEATLLSAIDRGFRG